MQMRQGTYLPLRVLIGLCMVGVAIDVQPAWAQNLELEHLRELKPVNSAVIPVLALPDEEWLAQMTEAAVQVTGVRLEQTETGLEVVLETAAGELAQPATSIVGNALILDFANVTLSLPDGEQFEIANPATGIALVTVTPRGAGIRLAITGLDAPPAAEVRTEAPFTVSVTPETIESEATTGETAGETADDAIQVMVTGEQEEEGYQVSETTTATRTETPILEIPQSIQVVPQELIEDQAATDLGDITRNVAGLNQFSVYQDFALRGFRISDESIFYNGLRGNPYSFFTSSPILSNVERVEVLRGPSSVLYGQLQPGGFINIVTRQPQAEPFTDIRGIAGSYEQFGIQVDSTGPIDDRETLLYRFNAVHLGADSFRDFQSSDYFQIAPSLTWLINDRTTLALTGEWFDDNRRGQRDRGIVAPGGNVYTVPIDFTVNEPDDEAGSTGYAIQLSLEHEFSADWQLNAAGRFAHGEYFNQYHNPSNFLGDLRTITRDYRDQEFTSDTFAADVYVQGDFATGSIGHTLVAGADTTIRDNVQEGLFADPIEDGGDVPSLDIFNPDYGRANPDDYTLLFDRSTDRLRQYGLYLQDQIRFSDQWQALLGLRYDFFDNESDSQGDFGSSESSFSDSALTLRGGVVYEPIDNLFMYASYSEGFVPQLDSNQGPNRGGPFDPEESWQVEVGAKSSLFDDRLTASLAFYYIIRENLLVTDPDNSDRLLQLGEARSQGIELELVGRITDDWSIIANYALNDAEVSADPDPNLVGRQLENAPLHTAALWTRYNIPNTGFGIAGGITFVDDRPTFDESVQLPSYLVLDAALYYAFRDLELALNFDNILDRTYFIGGYDDTAIFPGSPFTVRLTASYRF